LRWNSGLRCGRLVAGAGDDYLAWRIRRPAFTQRERAERAAATVAAAVLGEGGPLELHLVLEQLAVAAAIAAEESA
jgi:hypothetical protein